MADPVTASDRLNQGHCCLFRAWGWWLAILLLVGCSSASAPTAALDPLTVLLEKAKIAERKHDYETAAVALREAVELIAAQDGGAAEELEKTRQLCVKAMVEAGGNVASYRLWSDLAKKSPTAKEPQAMRERARRQMLQQGGELTIQVEADLDANKAQAALCTARAAVTLLQEAQGSTAEIQRAELALAQAQKQVP